MATTWFNAKHFTKNTIQLKIIPTPVYGYVLPHAGTEYTSEIIMHTLNIRNANYKDIKRVIIFYYPASTTEDIIYNGEKYFHEYYVPWQSIKHIFAQTNPTMEFYGYNISGKGSKTTLPKLGNIGSDTWIIISADFSHFIPLQTAIALENKCAMALQYKKWDWQNISQGVDDVKTFKFVFNLLNVKNKKYQSTGTKTNTKTTPKILRWVGRTRSSGTSGVGYLTFIITDNYSIDNNSNTVMPDGLFVTCYDVKMNTRECLGKWFDIEQKTPKQIKLLERELTNEVLQLGATTSRLTGGTFLDIPIKYYTVTYLFKSSDKEFNRGWHGVQSSGAFYLPDVFLENTYETGKWISPNNEVWPHNGNKFNMVPTTQSLATKAGLIKGVMSYTLYDCYVKHVKLLKKNII